MAVQEDKSDVIEVRVADGSQVLEVLLNQKLLSFTEQNWMDLKGKWVQPGMVSRFPVAFTLSLVLAVGCGSIWLKHKGKGSWALQKPRPTRPGQGICTLFVTVLGQRGWLLSLRSGLMSSGVPVVTIRPTQSPERPRASS